MFQFGGLLNTNFWQNYRQPSSPSIEDLLSKKDCTVEMLLDDDDVIQEFQQQNQKLLNYFTHDKLKELVDLITVMPAEDAEHKVGHKYPFRVSAIFDLELNTILDKFFEAAEPTATNEKTAEGNEDVEEENDTVKVVEGLEDLGDSDMNALTNDEDDEVTTGGGDDAEETSPTNENSEPTPQTATTSETVENDQKPQEPEEQEDKKKDDKSEEKAEKEDVSEQDEKSKEESKSSPETKKEDQESDSKNDDEKQDDEIDMPPEEESNKSETKKETTADIESKTETQPAQKALERQDTPDPRTLTEEDLKESPPKDVKESEKEETKVTEEETKESSQSEKDSEVAQKDDKSDEESLEKSKKSDETPSQDQPSEEEKEEEKPKESQESEDTELQAAAASSTQNQEDSTEATEMTQEDAEVTEEPNSDDEFVKNKYALLDRLMRLIRQKETPLNPVLAGYFSKLLCQLCTRKDKQLVPYVFAADCDVIDCLLYHSYQRSISEVLFKLLNINDTYFDEDLQKQMQEKRQMVVTELISKMSGKIDYEESLNALQILTDIMDINHFYQIIARRQNLDKLREIVTSTPRSDTNQDGLSNEARAATLNLLTRFLEAKQQREKNKKSWRDDEDSDERFGGLDKNADDVLMDAGSDDEEEKAAKKRSNEQIVIDMYESLIEPCRDIIAQEGPKEELKSQFNERSRIPLGLLRLRAIELLQQIASLKKTQLSKALLTSQVSQSLVALVQQYPWNNFLQIRVQMYFDELLDGDELISAEKMTLLTQSDLPKTLVAMSKDASIEFASGFAVRNGFMGFVTKVANLIVKLKDGQQLSTEQQEDSSTTTSDAKTPSPSAAFNELFDEDWSTFVAEELAQSNERDNRELGGRTGDADEDDGQFDVNMDRIMQRFKVFASSQQSSSSEEDDRDDEDENEADEDQEDAEENDDEDANKTGDADEEQEEDSAETNSAKKDITFEVKKIEVEMPKEEQVDSSYADSGYWKVSGCEQDLDDLLADYE